jgi:Zn-dependent M28 family amino/carboxypeptidase
MCRHETTPIAHYRFVTVKSSTVFVVLTLLLSSCVVESEPVGPTPGSPVFEGAVAMGHVQTQVAFGPRIPGTEGPEAQLSWMLKLMREHAAAVVVDTFTHVTTNGDTLGLTNLIGRFAPENSRRIVILAHWDTRPISDQASDSVDQVIPVPGANDGGSGTAILLALAPLLSAQTPPVGVDILLVDGEDYGHGIEDMLLGSRRYATTVSEEDRPVYGLLLDMVGDAEPSFPVEQISAQFANPVVQKVWRAAERLGYRDYFPTAIGPPITDDHVPLIQNGIPTANVIDFTYGPDNSYWHTPEDTPDKVSAGTLGIVGQVVVELIYSGG